MEKLKIGTVCSGIGSPEMALKNLGVDHEISFACEIDKYARKSYLENFMPNLMINDMTKQKWENNNLYSDIFIGGIPCQAFSLAGKRLGELDPRGLLFFDFYRYVDNQRPKYFIIENVKGLLSMDRGRVFQNWKDLLGRSENGIEYFFKNPDSLNYNLHWQVLNTKDYGLPQNRERVFLIGIREDLPNDFIFPKKKILKLRLKHVLEKEVDEKYYLSDKMINYLVSQQDKRANKFTDVEYKNIANCITSNYSKQSTDCEYIIGAMRGRNPDNPKARVPGQSHQQMLEINENGISNCLSTVQKDNLVIEFDFPKVEYQLTGGKWDKTHEQSGRVYSKNGIAPTIHTMGGGNQEPKISEGINVRKLTPLECFRLQGYSDDFFHKCKNVNSDTQLYKQAGNTISVPVIQAILKNILKI